MKNRRSACLLAISALVTLPAISLAGGIVNGGFDSNLDGWDQNGSALWNTEGTPGNGFCRLNGAGSIGQSKWLCGDKVDPNGTCLVTFRYRADASLTAPVLQVTFGNSGAVGVVTNFDGTNNLWRAGTVTSKECNLKDILFSQIGNVAVDLDDIKDVCVEGAPEPSSMLALGAGAAMLGWRRRRAKK